jgi:hypothetical protein
MLHPLLENMLQTIEHFEICCLRALFSWLRNTRNCMGQDLDCMADVLMGVPLIHFFQAEYRFQFRSHPMLGFFNHEEGVQRQETLK